jgi:16S rRNA (guanine966-N2)-methyltransferase
VRIISGEWRGRPLADLNGQGTRPTSDRAREGLFSMLASRVGSFEGLAVADLFAGTGALGLEALSRGARQCLFVEHDRSALDTLRSNVDRFGVGERADVRSQGVEHVAPPRPRDLVFLDPPYGKGLADMALARIADPAWVAPGGWVSVETAGEALAIPAAFTLETERRFGKAYIHLLRRT